MKRLCLPCCLLFSLLLGNLNLYGHYGHEHQDSHSGTASHETAAPTTSSAETSASSTETSASSTESETETIEPSTKVAAPSQERAADAEMALAAVAAQAWLELMDARQYGAAFTATTSDFKDLFAESDWIASVEQIRAKIGQQQGRTLQFVDSADRLPGTEIEGEFAIVQFRVYFAYTEKALKEVVTMEAIDNKWVPNGYYLF